MKQKPALEVIAMHGWAGDARCWLPWQKATTPLGWQWNCGERGYGHLPPCQPSWSLSPTHGTTRLVIGHSLGPHLLPSDVWQQAELVVLLASFAAFVPPGRQGRPVRAALKGMAGCLDNEAHARAMLSDFLAKAAAPKSVSLMPASPIDDELDHVNCVRLREDLSLLERCNRLPEGFPLGVPTLIVEAGEDQIVAPEARTLLRESLPHAEIMTLEGAGHALLCAELIERVVTWVGKQR
jgi:pimeloyl-[acyl-carrier protein] methyl ester esterase